MWDMLLLFGFQEHSLDTGNIAGDFYGTSRRSCLHSALGFVSYTNQLDGNFPGWGRDPCTEVGKLVHYAFSLDSIVGKVSFLA